MYVLKWKEFRFLPGAKRAIKKLTDAGYSIYIISNQAGIAKKYFTLKDLKAITKKMAGELEKSGGKIKAAFYCPHSKEDNCGCRKPKTGLFKKALKKGNIDFRKTYFIGDNIRDVVAGKAIGCKTVLVLSGKVKSRNSKGWEAKPDLIKKDLLEAVESILRKENGE
jgi:histidinol-phosphate phosphatase family protein